MSKYARTKDRVFELSGAWGFFDVVNNKKAYETIQPPHFLEETDIIKEADTIKELCDCWVFIDKCIPNSIPKIYYDWDKLFFENQYQEELGLDRDECEVYGAIWTNKGLIYVARKIKEYGEWVLL